MKHLPLAVCAAAVLLLAPGLHADDDLCPTGKVASARSKGHCCWPEQTWDDAQKMCAGKPACPQGMERDGLTCVTGANAPPPPPASVVTPVQPAPAQSAAVPPTVADSPPPERTQPANQPVTYQTKMNLPLVITGASALGLGYIAALGFAAIGTIVVEVDKANKGASCGESIPYSFIPLVGPFLTMLKWPDHDIVQYEKNPTRTSNCTGRGRTAINAAAWTDGLLQLGGAAMLTVGLLVKKKGPVSNTSFVEVMPGTAQTPVGFTVRLVTF